MTITTEELAHIRSAAVGDMLGDSKTLDEIGPSAIIFRLCRDVGRAHLPRRRPKHLPRLLPGPSLAQPAQDADHAVQCLSLIHILRDADLRDADLRGATGKILSFGPIGSRQGITYVTKTERTVHVRCGCFYGTLEEFAAKVEKEHGDSQHGKSYKAAIEFIKAHDAACWQDDVEE